MHLVYGLDGGDDRAWRITSLRLLQIKQWPGWVEGQELHMIGQGSDAVL